GPGATLPLPRLMAERSADLDVLVAGGTELRYWTYSVFMSRSRRLPFLSAANFDRSAQRNSRRPSHWSYDPRLAAEETEARALQLGDDWYSRQDQGRTVVGPFDRGHLTAFENGDWGAEAPRNGVDTFHFTNCAPQAKAFNETKLWRQIEVWAAAQGQSGRVSIFNGPVFDAPISTPRPDGEFNLNPLADSSPDPVIRGVSVPKQFFKVAVYLKSDELAAQCFLVTQEGYLPDARELLGPTPTQLSIYRVPLTIVMHVTGIDFSYLA